PRARRLGAAAAGTGSSGRASASKPSPVGRGDSRGRSPPLRSTGGSSRAERSANPQPAAAQPRRPSGGNGGSSAGEGSPSFRTIAKDRAGRAAGTAAHERGASRRGG